MYLPADEIKRILSALNLPVPPGSSISPEWLANYVSSELGVQYYTRSKAAAIVSTVLGAGAKLTFSSTDATLWDVAPSGIEVQSPGGWLIGKHELDNVIFVAKEQRKGFLSDRKRTEALYDLDHARRILEDRKIPYKYEAGFITCGGEMYSIYYPGPTKNHPRLYASQIARMISHYARREILPVEEAQNRLGVPSHYRLPMNGRAGCLFWLDGDRVRHVITNYFVLPEVLKLEPKMSLKINLNTKTTTITRGSVELTGRDILALLRAARPDLEIPERAEVTAGRDCADVDADNPVSVTWETRS